MNALEQIRVSYRKANQDTGLLPSHVSLYFGLIWVWTSNNFANSFKVYRKELMHFSHISSIATYHKCIKELTAFGYIDYKSSYNYYEGCQVIIIGSCAGC